MNRQDDALIKIEKHGAFDIMFVRNIDNNDIVPIIMANSFVNPFDYIYDIKVALGKNNNYKCIIFDLLLCNGNSISRLVKVCVKNDNICISKYEYVKELPSYVILLLNKYYKDNVKNIDNSNLSRVQKFLIKKELETGFNYSVMLPKVEVINDGNRDNWSRYFCGEDRGC